MSTIFAPITSINQGGVCVIRISGARSLDCLNKLGIDRSKILPQKTTFQKIIDLKNKEIIDECLVTYFKEPLSFTGEDVIEISIHASNYIFHKISNILRDIEDIRFAEAGEFSKRAFFNNKIGLIEAEAIPDLIASETEMQHKQAIKQLSGKVGQVYDNLRLDIINVLALINAAIDFPDDDLPEDIIKSVNSDIENIKNIIKNIINDGRLGQKIKNGLSLAIIGEPNVGKSTLINFLANSEIAIVSDIAGTTRDVIEAHLDIAGVPVKIADTAGIRHSKDKIEQEGVRRAFKEARISDIKILVLDAKNPKISDQIIELIDKETVIIANKIDEIDNFNQESLDKLSKNSPHLAPFLKNIIKISLKNKINLDLLISSIEQQVKNQIPSQNSAIITKERHRDCLKLALNYIEDFSLNKPIEIAAEDLRLAAQEIAQITGKIDVENILDVIFSSFCIGK